MGFNSHIKNTLKCQRILTDPPRHQTQEATPPPPHSQPDIRPVVLHPSPDIRPGELPPPLDITPGDLPPPPAIESGGNHWRPVQACSLEDLSPSPHRSTDIQWWSPKHVQLAISKRAVRILLECCLDNQSLAGGFPSYSCSDDF